MPQRVGRALTELWLAGKISPLVGTVVPLERAADALREIEERRAVGKLVLAVRD
jgi:NADPH2:quinone reductase